MRFFVFKRRKRRLVGRNQWSWKWQTAGKLQSSLSASARVTCVERSFTPRLRNKNGDRKLEPRTARHYSYDSVLPPVQTYWHTWSVLGVSSHVLSTIVECVVTRPWHFNKVFFWRRGGYQPNGSRPINHKWEKTCQESATENYKVFNLVFSLFLVDGFFSFCSCITWVNNSLLMINHFWIDNR